MRTPNRVALAVFAVMVFVPLSIRPASAQVPNVLQGRVADAQNLAPVVGAFVAQPGSPRGVLTDSLGMFALQMTGTYARAIRVVQIGYRELETDVPADGEGRVLNVLLVPNPIELDGITVLTERLADRRRGIYGIADILMREDLVTGGEGSGIDLVRRMLPFVTPCDPQASEALCMGGRVGPDGNREVTVCIDDTRVPSEVVETMLSGVDPRNLYLVETYSRVGEVRMYTPGYMQRLISEDMDLPPLSFGCTGPMG